MKRRTLDYIFSVGGVLLAVLLLVLGFVLRNNANFAKNYVHDQLSQQQITFSAKDKLTPAEQQSACLVKYAGLAMTTGKQAECYANEYIADHLKTMAKSAGYDGMTYATLGTPYFALQAQVAAAQKANDPKLADLQTKFTALGSLRDTVFKGETLRGLLLTSYGFSQFGDKASQAAYVCFLVFALMLLLSGAGFVHAFFAHNRLLAGAVDSRGTPVPASV